MIRRNISRCASHNWRITYAYKSSNVKLSFNKAVATIYYYATVSVHTCTRPALGRVVLGTGVYTSMSADIIRESYSSSTIPFARRKDVGSLLTKYGVEISFRLNGLYTESLGGKLLL